MNCEWSVCSGTATLQLWLNFGQILAGIGHQNWGNTSEKELLEHVYYFQILFVCKGLYIAHSTCLHEHKLTSSEITIYNLLNWGECIVFVFENTESVIRAILIIDWRLFPWRQIPLKLKLSKNSDFI